MTIRVIGRSERSKKIKKGGGFSDGDAGEKVQYKLEGIEKER